MGPTSGGSIGSQGWWDTSSPPRLLLRSTLHYTGNAERHVAQASSSVLGPSGPDRPRDPLVPAYGGAIGYRGMVDPVHYLACYAVVPLTDCRMTSTGLHVGTVVGGV